MINTRLFEHYSINIKKNLHIKKRCPRPFDTVLIDKQGSCYACECQSWLPQSIGNLQIKSLAEIVGSGTHQQLQQSITDSSYRYCNENQCSYIKGGRLMHSNTDKIQHLRLAIDDSCNLKCPSCRKHLIFHKEGSVYNLGIKLANKINNWLEDYDHPVQVHIGSDGDPFASHVYRHFMANTPIKSNIKYSLLTNGLMFKDFYKKVPWVIENLQELGISIDGASKHTYEKLRLGGKWDKINENLKCISDLKKKYNFRFILHFVVQKDNYHEMEDIIKLGEQYSADRVWLNKIEDWSTMEDFSLQNIWNQPDYKQKLSRVIDLIHSRNNDRFIECPTLITEAVRYKNKN